jgi:hypothetical protein
MKHVLIIRLGDWSGDCGGVTDTVVAKSSLSTEDVQRAYVAGVEAIGVDITYQLATSWNDCLIPKHLLVKLNELGFFEEPIKDTDSVELDKDEFIRLYLFMVKLGNKKFRYKVLKQPALNIGGYGVL